MEFVAQLQAKTEFRPLLAVALVLAGVAFAVRGAFSRLAASRKQQPLFPRIAGKSERLVGPQICSTHEAMAYAPKLEENGDINWNLSYDDYYAPPAMPHAMPPTMPHALPHTMPLGQLAPEMAPQAPPQAPTQLPSQLPPQQLPSAPATVSYAPVRRMAIPTQHHAPYQRHSAPKPQNDVQIISPSYFPQWGYNYPELNNSVAPQLVPMDHKPMSPVPALAPPANPVPVDLGEPVYEPSLDYSIVNDVLDVVYDDRSSFVAPNASSLEPVSYSSGSDHSGSDHEYLSPPYVYTSAAQPSPRSPEDEGSTLSDTPSLESSSERFVCPHCNADFRIKGYLTRHLKKHARLKAYTCPFYDPASGQKCHPNGGFSRRDTYKTHLKARHFVYPQNTPCSERANVAGTCSGCNKEFASNETWVETHIQTRMCTALK